MHLMAEAENKTLNMTAGMLQVSEGCVLIIVHYKTVDRLYIDPYVRGPQDGPLTDKDIAEALNSSMLHYGQELGIIAMPDHVARN